MAVTKQQVQSIIDENKVVVFSKSYCPYCRQTKSTLDELNADYKVVELDLLRMFFFLLLPNLLSRHREMHLLTPPQPTEARSRTSSSRSRASAPSPTATSPRSISAATPTSRASSRATSSRTCSRRPTLSRRKETLFSSSQKTFLVRENAIEVVTGRRLTGAHGTKGRPRPGCSRDARELCNKALVRGMNCRDTNHAEEPSR